MTRLPEGSRLRGSAVSLSGFASDLPPEGLRQFASALRELGSARDFDEALQLSVDLATELAPDIDIADVLIVRGAEITTPVASHPLARELARMQQEVGEGPCLTAALDEEMVVCQDLEEDERWPRFSEGAMDLGIRSTIAYRLFVHGNGEDRLGALDLFGRKPGLDESSIELGGVFAAHCSTVLHAAIKEQGLQRALSSRDLIGQAKGILMERHKVSADQAYAMLRRASNDLNVKVRDLAERVITVGGLPRT